MLSDDPKKLRFLGIDLRSRGRRRVLVCLTYFLFLFAMAGVQTFFDDHHVTSHWWTLPGGFWELAALMLVTCAFSSGIFRENGPVKPFGPHKLFKRYGDRLILETRDDLARYLHEKPLAELSLEEQAEVKRRWRPGRHLAKDKAFFAPGLPDERELAEVGRASRTALGILCFLLMMSAGTLARYGVDLHSGAATVDCCELALAAFTLPKAIILWGEADPREYAMPEDRAQAPQNL